MADLRQVDPLVSTESEIEVDHEIAAAIERGIRDAEEGRLVSAVQVRDRVRDWISKFSTQNRP